MALNVCPHVIFILFILPSLSSASERFIDSVSDELVLLESSDGTTARRLLQTKKPCPINFQFQNYTILTSQCKGPDYPPIPCCNAFKQFMCPFVAEVNDLSNVCSETMFSYINLNGGYYPGLFASICHDGKDGLSCPALPPKSNNYSSNAAHIGRSFSSPLIVFSFSFTLGVLCF